MELIAISIICTNKKSISICSLFFRINKICMLTNQETIRNNNELIASVI